MSTLIFYAQPVSNYCAKVEIVLGCKCLAFESREPPGGYGSVSYRAIVPGGTIPALIDGDLTLSESEIINEYLNERFPEPPLLHGDPASRAHQRLLARFHDLCLEPPLRALFRHMDPAERDPEFCRARIGEFQLRLDQLAEIAAPRPFLASEQLSLADCGYPPTLLLAERMLGALGSALQLPAKLRAWQEHVSAHPAVARVLDAYEPAVVAWLRRKAVDC